MSYTADIDNDTQYHDTNLDILNIQHSNNTSPHSSICITSNHDADERENHGIVETTADTCSDKGSLKTKLLLSESFNGRITEEIIDEMGCLTNLNKTAEGTSLAYLNLDISNMNISDVDEIQQYEQIQVVNLSNNSITDLNPLSSLPYLVDLNASNNRLSELLKFQAPFSLKFANFSFNCIKKIPSLSDFQYLIELDVSNNEIEEIPVGSFCNSTRLQRLSLGHNKIRKIENLEELRLVYLDLQYNIIAEITNLETLKHLQILNLAGNMIKSLKNLRHLKALYSLDVSENEIIDLQELRHIKHLNFLRQLNLNKNPVQNIPDYRLLVIHQLSALTHLDNNRVLVEEKVKAENQENPTIEIIAQRDHRLNMVYSFFQPHYILDSTLQSSDTPYPMLVLVGPNGSMKKHLALKLVNEFPEYFGYGVSHTTRPPFEDEESGKEYVFVTPGEFEELQLKGKFIQTSMFQNHCYGLTVEAVEAVAREGLACVVHMELEGVIALKKTYFEPRYVLTLPLNKYLHEKHLRIRPRKEQHIRESVARADLYVSYHQEHPGFFDMVVCTDEIMQAYNELKALVMNYLGLTTEDGVVDKHQSDYASASQGKPLSRTWSKTSQQSSVFNNNRPLAPHTSGKGQLEEESVRRRHSAAKEVIASGRPRGQAADVNKQRIATSTSDTDSVPLSGRHGFERLDLGSSEGQGGIGSSNPKAPRSRAGLNPPTGATTYSPGVA